MLDRSFRVSRGSQALAALAVALSLAGCASLPAGPLDETVTVGALSPASIGTEPLRLRLVAVHDQRCAVDVRCVWAGHASVTVQVQRGASRPELVLLGTPSPPGMTLPGAGRAGPYDLQLFELDPPNHSVLKPTLLQYRATIRVRHAPAR